jgi:hypothetical protein
MIAATFRPLPVWPYPATNQRRSRWTFKASWASTLDLLDREIASLGGGNVIIAAGFSDADLRQDGWPRAGAKVPPHPGVEISFDCSHGRLVYATDVCAWWEHNVRSIALGLEALRAVDRYGVTRRGEQYAGWRQLTAGSAGPELPTTVEQAWEVLYDVLDPGEVGERGDVADLRRLIRAAQKAAHPDTGGDHALFLRVQAAARLLEAVHA